MDIQTEKNNQSAYRLAKVSLALGIISILGPALLELWVVDPTLELMTRLKVIGNLEMIAITTWILSLPSLIIGDIALRKMKEKYRGKGFAVAGMILGGLCFLIYPFIFIATHMGG